MFLALQEEENLFFVQLSQPQVSQGDRVARRGFHGKAGFSENPEFPKGLSRHGRFKLTIHWQNASCPEMIYKERTINGRVFPEMDPRKSLCLMWRDKLPMKLVVVAK